MKGKKPKPIVLHVPKENGSIDGDGGPDNKVHGVARLNKCRKLEDTHEAATWF